VHLERLEDVLVDVDFEVVAAESFDDLAEEDVAEVGITPAAAGRESDVGVGKHGGNLAPLGGLEGLPVAVGGVVAVPRPGGVAEAGAVGEQMANGDGVNGTVSRVHLAQLGDVLHGRIVEGEQAAVAQLENGDGGHGLGDGGPVVGGVGVDGARGLLLRLAVEDLGCGRGAAHKGEAAADNTVAGEHGFKAGLKRGELCLGLGVCRGRDEEDGCQSKGAERRGVWAIQHGLMINGTCGAADARCSLQVRALPSIPQTARGGWGNGALLICGEREDGRILQGIRPEGPAGRIRR